MNSSKIQIESEEQGFTDNGPITSWDLNAFSQLVEPDSNPTR